MRLKILFTVILLHFGVTASFCDVGNCVRYKAELIYNDSHRLTGFIQIVGYDPMIELDDALFLSYLRKNLERKNRDSFTFYKKMQTIEFPRLESQTYGFKYSAAAKEDIVTVNLDEIKNICLHEICPCEHGDFSEIRRGRPEDAYLINYHHWIIEDLTQSEIDLLQTEPVYMTDRENPLSDSGIERLYVLCYDNSIPESTIEQLSSGLYLHISDEKATQQISLERKIKHYNQVKEDLRKKKIIALIIRGYN